MGNHCMCELSSVDKRELAACVLCFQVLQCSSVSKDARRGSKVWRENTRSGLNRKEGVAIEG